MRDVQRSSNFTHNATNRSCSFILPSLPAGGPPGRNWQNRFWISLYIFLNSRASQSMDRTWSQGRLLLDFRLRLSSSQFFHPLAVSFENYCTLFSVTESILSSGLFPQKLALPIDTHEAEKIAWPIIEPLEWPRQWSLAQTRLLFTVAIRRQGNNPYHFVHRITFRSVANGPFTNNLHSD